MKSQTTEGDITLRSLKLDEWKSIPSKLIVEGFMRNGKLHKKNPKYFTLVFGIDISSFHFRNALAATVISDFYASMKVNCFLNVSDYHA